MAALTQPRVLEDADAARERGRGGVPDAAGPGGRGDRRQAAGDRARRVAGPAPLRAAGRAGGEGGPRFLVQGHSIRYAPSLTALHMIGRWEAERPAAGRALWALGDPVYAPTDARLAVGGRAVGRVDPARGPAPRRGRGAAFERLAGTGREVDRLAGLMGPGPGSGCSAPEATEAAVKRLSADGTLAKYRYVHFACHGVLGTGDGAPARPGPLAGRQPARARTATSGSTR